MARFEKVYFPVVEDVDGEEVWRDMDDGCSLKALARQKASEWIRQHQDEYETYLIPSYDYEVIEDELTEDDLA